MSKEVHKVTCRDCESTFKLMYDLDDTSGYARFCPFCGGEIFNEEDNESEEPE